MRSAKVKESSLLAARPTKGQVNGWEWECMTSWGLRSWKSPEIHGGFFQGWSAKFGWLQKHQISSGGTHSEGSPPHGNWDVYGSKPSATARPGGTNERWREGLWAASLKAALVTDKTNYYLEDEAMKPAVNHCISQASRWCLLPVAFRVEHVPVSSRKWAGGHCDRQVVDVEGLQGGCCHDCGWTDQNAGTLLAFGEQDSGLCISMTQKPSISSRGCPKSSEPMGMTWSFFDLAWNIARWVRWIPRRVSTASSPASWTSSLRLPGLSSGSCGFRVPFVVYKLMPLHPFQLSQNFIFLIWPKLINFNLSEKVPQIPPSNILRRLVKSALAPNPWCTPWAPGWHRKDLEGSWSFNDFNGVTKAPLLSTDVKIHQKPRR